MIINKELALTPKQITIDFLKNDVIAEKHWNLWVLLWNLPDSKYRT